MILLGLKLTFAVWLYLLLWMRKLTNAIVVYTFVLSCGYMYNTCQSRLVLMRLLTNKLFLPGLKLTDTWAVYTCVVLLTGITFVCDVSSRKCYMILPGLKLTFAVWLYLLLWMRKLTSAIVVYTFAWSCGYMYIYRTFITTYNRQHWCGVYT